MSSKVDDKCPVCFKKNITYQRPYGESPFLSCNDLHQCQDCGLIFAHKMPQKEVLEKYYSHGLFHDQINDHYNREFLRFSYKLSLIRCKLIKKEIMQFNGTPKVIDIGAGSARFGIAFKEFYKTAIYETVEPDSGAHNNYGDWVDQHYKDIADVHDKNYDLVVMNQVLEHLPDPIEFLKSVCKLLKDQGYIYIDVPYKDFLFKPSVEPHLLFWNHNSFSLLIELVGLKLIFCDTAGMRHEKAKRFFNQNTFLEKISNPWFYTNKLNQIMNKISFPLRFDTFKQFEADQYGGDRQWLRCIAQKIN